VSIGHRAWVWGLVGFAGLLAVYVVMALLGWPGEANGCTLPGGDCYCEAYPPAGTVVLARQPANTFSTLFAVVSGLIILAIADRDRARGGVPANPMAAGRFHAVLYGLLVVFLGPGSAFFHGGLTRFGGWLDNESMLLFVTFILCYDAARVWRWDDRVGLFAAVYLVVNVGLGLLTWFAEGIGTILFAVLAGTAIVSQFVIIAARPAGIERRWAPWFIAAMISFGVASVIWALSSTGRPLCDPASLLQGHAVWHVLAMAVAPFCVFRYLRDEVRA
jgi:hypothetical protein